MVTNHRSFEEIECVDELDIKGQADSLQEKLLIGRPNSLDTSLIHQKFKL